MDLPAGGGFSGVSSVGAFACDPKRLSPITPVQQRIGSRDLLSCGLQSEASSRKTTPYQAYQADVSSFPASQPAGEDFSSEGAWAALGLATQLDRANAPVFAVSVSGVVSEWNHYMGQLSGSSRDLAVGSNLLVHLAENSHQRWQDALKGAAAKEMRLPTQLQLDESKGATTLLVSLTPQLNNSGQVIGVFCLGQVLVGGGDRSANAMDTMKPSNSKTMGMVMHELRSPLHGIIGLSNTLSQDTSPMQKPLAMIGSSAERVLELVTNLMDYWNLAEDDTPDIAQDPFDFSTLMNESLARSQQTKDRKGKPMKKDKVSLIIDVPSDLPAIRGDPQKIIQMLHHLIINGLKFTTQGHVKVSVSVNAHAEALDVVVEDTGIGVAQANLKRIFMPFQQEDASSASRHYDGIGVGLAIVAQVVKMHQGSITVNSTQSKGSTFRISLPFRPAFANGAATMNVPIAALVGTLRWARPSLWLGPVDLLRPSIGSTATPSQCLETLNGAAQTKHYVPKLVGIRQLQETPRHGGTILSVDDDHINQEVMRAILEPCGFTIIVCMDGHECLEYIDREDAELPDMILLDLMMPGINGFDVVEAQRKKYTKEQLPIVMVSAQNQASSVVKGLEMGCNDWIHKPFDKQELIARVNVQLDSRAVALSNANRLAGFTEEAQELAAPPGGPQRPLNLTEPELPPPQPLITMVDSSALFMVIVPPVQSSNLLVRIFEAFETLSDRYGTHFTEIVGTCYIAAARAEASSMKHADRILQLALCMQDVVRQVNGEHAATSQFKFRIGIHTDSEVPAVINSKQYTGGFRQYPNTAFFSHSVSLAKKLGECQAQSCLLFSRATRSRISADVESEVHKRGLEIVEVSASPAVQLGEAVDHFCLVRSDGIPEPVPAPCVAANPLWQSAIANPKPTTEEMASKQCNTEAQVERFRGMEAHAAQLQDNLRLVQEELQTKSGQLAVQQQHAEKKDVELRTELRTLRAQLGQLQAASGTQPLAAPNHCEESTTSSLPHTPAWHGCGPRDSMAEQAGASLLFLQWQNAHLHAELMSSKQQLISARAEAQVAAVNQQHAETMRQSLSERVEHLQLDLWFRSAALGIPPGHSSLAQGAQSQSIPGSIGDLGRLGIAGLAGHGQVSSDDMAGHAPSHAFGALGTPAATMPGASLSAIPRGPV